MINLPSHKLASVNSIFLLGTINTLNMGESSTERAIHPLFKHLEDTNKKLAALGYEIMIPYFCGDSPISQSMCGMVEGVGTANYPCRQCLTHKTEILMMTSENQCALRTKNQTYLLQNQEDKKGLVKVPNFWEYQFFDAILQTPQDIMHVILEGVCRYQVMRIFEECLRAAVTVECLHETEMVKF